MIQPKIEVHRDHNGIVRQVNVIHGDMRIPLEVTAVEFDQRMTRVGEVRLSFVAGRVKFVETDR